jgi:hypothetical protein
MPARLRAQERQVSQGAQTPPSEAPTWRAALMDERRRAVSGLSVALHGRAGVALFLALIWLALLAPDANAETTHPYLGQINLSMGEAPQAVGTDANGNIIVWLEAQQEVAKFTPLGQPAPFAALGTNILDGKGGSNCPATPSDCDQVPSNGFNTWGFPFTRYPLRVAVDQSVGNPTSGYIYVASTGVASSGGASATIEAFDSTGRYRGRVDETLAEPINNAFYPAESVSVAPNGSIYVDHREYRCTIDKYVPEDGIPGHDKFAGQLYTNYKTVIVGEVNRSIDKYCTGGAVGDNSFIYDHSADDPRWRKFAQSEFIRKRQLTEPSLSIDFSPTQCRCEPDGYPFGNGGAEPERGTFSTLGVDPETHHVYLFNPTTSHIAEWSEDNERVGPIFGNHEQTGDEGGGDATSIAFDNSSGGTAGRFYLQSGSHSLAAYGPPVVVPDIENVEDEPGHTSSVLRADLGTAGAGPIESCEVEYGPDVSYGGTVPCSPAAPYGSDAQVTASLTGLAIGHGYHYHFVVENANGVNASDDRVTRTVAVLSVHTGAATDLTPHSANLNGELDPDGMPTEYRFEYGSNEEYGSRTPFAPAGSSSGVEQLPPVELSGLQPRHRYHYRLVARNELGITYGNDETFVAPGTPAIEGLSTSEVTAQSAALEARIDSLGYDTEYHFEYGSTTNYGTDVPVSGGNLPGESTAAKVKQAISGLEEGVQYHFRLVASNKWGSSVSDDSTFSFGNTPCPNAHVRQETGATYLPDCRAYEIVSPSDSAPLQLFPGNETVDGDRLTGVYEPYFGIKAYNASGMANNPERFAYIGTLGAIPGLEATNTVMDLYVATRTEHGWITTYPGLKGSEAPVAGKPECDMWLSKCIDYAVTSLGRGHGSLEPYVWDVSGKSLGRWPTNLASVPGGERELVERVPYTGDSKPSADFSHYVFSTLDVAYAPGGVTEAPGSVYDNAVRTGAISVASKLPNGADIPLDGGPPDEYLKIPAVSRDGSHILISSTASLGPNHLYMRVDDSITYDIARGTGATFVGMTADGSRVVFSSVFRLTPDDTDSSVDLYMWEEAGDKLTLISKGNGQGNSDGCNAGWIAGCGVAPLSPERLAIDDAIAAQTGDVYFYSPEQLDPENPGVPGERNLYVYRKGTVRYVATFEPGTGVSRSQISADGSHFAFFTSARLTGYDNKGWREVYVYSADSGRLTCASCIPDGSPPSIPHGGGQLPISKDAMATQSGRFMSDDGRVVFATSDALVPRDTDGQIDVYEFVDGRPQLISSGRTLRDEVPEQLPFYTAEFLGVEAISADGRDIYFSTYDSLVPQDRIGSFLKFYDARVDGGFPAKPEFEGCRAADECHGPGSGAPAGASVGTGADLGAGGNVRSPRKRRHHRHHLHRRHKSRHKVRNSPTSKSGRRGG